MERYINCDGRTDKRGLMLVMLVQEMRGLEWSHEELRELIEEIAAELDCRPMGVDQVLLCLDILGELTIRRPEAKSHYRESFVQGDQYGIVDQRTEVDELLDACEIVETHEFVSFPADHEAVITGVLEPELVEWMLKGLRDCLPDETRVLEASDETTYMVKDGRVMVELRLPVSLLSSRE